MCPEQYEGTLDTGESFYARYRWGHGRLEVDGETVSEVVDADDPLRGYFEQGQLAELFNKARITLDTSLLKG